MAGYYFCAGEGEDANLFSKDTGLQKEKRQEVC